MTVFEKLVSLDSKNGLGAGWIKFDNQTSCPAAIEHKHNIIGVKKMNRFCQLGCSVECLDEYLDLKIKS